MKKKKNINSLIKKQIGGDWLNLMFPVFLKRKERFRAQINKERFPISKENISSRVLHHWHEKEVFNDTRKSKIGWRKLSIIDAIWINIIKILREFGFSLKKIKKVKRDLEYLNMEEKDSFAILEFYLSYIVYFKKPVKILVFKNGEAIISRQIDIDNYSNLIEGAYVSIDLNKVFSNLILDDIIVDYIYYSSTNIEKEIQKGIYLENVKSIKIKVNDDDILLEKEHIKYSRDEIKSLINKVGDYYEETAVKKGKKKFYKILEMKKTKK